MTELRKMVLVEISTNEPAMALLETLMEDINGTIHETCVTDPLTENETVTIEFLSGVDN